MKDKEINKDNKAKPSKRQKITFDSINKGNYKVVDMSNFYENKKKREEAEGNRREKEKLEEELRIKAIICPCCKSEEKHHHIKRESNGIMGPGFSSWIVENYLICLSCGIHYSDLSSLKK